MDHNKRYFINILSDHISGKKTAFISHIDWNVIMKLSVSHQMDGIVYYQCKEYMPPDIRSHYEMSLSTILFFYKNRRVAMCEIAEAFKDKGISFYVVKGFAIADYYPISYLRTMGDCDIIVNRADMAATQMMMRELGYRGIYNERADSWECSKNGLLFEVHDKLVQQSEHVSSKQLLFFNDFELHAINGILDWNFHFLYLLMHLRKHFLNSGVGIRQFLDIAVIMRNVPELDWDLIFTQLQQLNLLKFAQSCFWLVKMWFDVKLPFDCESMDIDFYEQITEKILRNGIFGSDDKRNIGNFERNKLIKMDGNIWINRLRLIIQNTFPPYEYMRKYPECKYVDGHPFLLPVSWMHRYFAYLKRTKRNTVGRVLGGIFSDQERIDEQKKLLEKMGL